MYMYKYPHDVQIWIHHIYTYIYVTIVHHMMAIMDIVSILYIYDGQINHGISGEILHTWS